MDNASSISERLNTLKVLHDNGIYSVLFMSPIFPGITNFRKMIEYSKDFVDEYWFENLNLRGSYKEDILDYIRKSYPGLMKLYREIYLQGNMEYWRELAIDIEEYCNTHLIKHINYFYHNKLVQAKSNQQ